MEGFFNHWLFYGLSILAILFVLGTSISIITIATMYLIDITQTKHAIRRNYPVIGRFRYLFEHLGEFFRQYFFAMDREELPFNRAERSWVYRASKNVDSTVAFGSTHNQNTEGAVYFVNTPYPTLDEDAVPVKPMTIGPYCDHPYTALSLINISGMSFGAISAPAVRALGLGAKRANCWLNTGEGGLSKYHLESGCDIVFQVGTAKFGIQAADGGLCENSLRKVAMTEQVKMFEIKLSQGAKPGKGGILPASKISAEVSEVRKIPMGKDAFSPNRHPEIEDVETLLDMIEKVRSVTRKPTGIKTVLGTTDWLAEFCEAIHNRGIESAPDFIALDGGDGGTGAAPMSLIDAMGMPLHESLPILVDILTYHKLRERIKVIGSGKLITPTSVAWALAIGADFVVSARGFMFSLGCIQALSCNKNTCPTGITTHDPALQKGLNPQDKSVRVANYVENLTKEVGTIAHSCGVKEPRGLKREHARIVTQNGKSISLAQLYPEVKMK